MHMLGLPTYLGKVLYTPGKTSVFHTSFNPRFPLKRKNQDLARFPGAWCSGWSIRPVLGREQVRISLNSPLLGLKQLLHP